MSDAVIRQLRAAGVQCFTRAEWGSPRERAGDYARRARTHPMPSGPADYHFLHITVTADTDTVREGKAGARQVETYGLSSPPMVSYQDLVTNEGRYYQGQDYGTKGTHTVNDKNVPGFPHNLNYHGYATALMQNVGDAVTDEQVRLVAMIFAARELAGLVKRGAPIYPHRKFDWKSCPGDKAIARLGEIRRLRDQYVRNGLPNNTTQEDEDMPFTDWPKKDRDALAKAVAAEVRQSEYARYDGPGGSKKDDPMRWIQHTQQSRGFSMASYREARQAKAAIRALARGLGAEVEQAVESALKDAAVEVTVDVTQSKE